MYATNPTRPSIAEYVAEQQRRPPIAEVEAPEPQMKVVLERLRYCIDDLQSAVGALCARIDPVLNPVAPEFAGKALADGVAPVPVRCHLGANVDMQSDTVCSITAQIRDILSRLAV